MSKASKIKLTITFQKIKSAGIRILQNLPFRGRRGFLFLFLLSSCTNHTPSKMENNTIYAFRLKPGQDLKQEIQKLVTEKQIKAGWINTGVGSLTNYTIRFANQPNGSSDSGHFEIVSLTGTVSVNGSHLHISISDSTGKTIGGHLMDGCKIYTTAEIVIGSSNDFIFKREKDGTTHWEELQVEEVKK
jgi:predicted DNA-binding protein with PD1-like motif